MIKLEKKYGILLITLIIILMSGISSCKKYEEGPFISFRTVMNRITGEWTVKEVVKNGEKQSISIYTLHEIEFNEDGTGIYRIIVTSQHYENPLLHSEEFNWEFVNDNDYLKIEPINNSQNRSVKGPEPEDEEDDPGTVIVIDEQEALNLIDLNIYARIQKLTNSELWIEDSKPVDEHIVITNIKLEKK